METLDDTQPVYSRSGEKQMAMQPVLDGLIAITLLLIAAGIGYLLAR